MPLYIGKQKYSITQVVEKGPVSGIINQNPNGINPLKIWQGTEEEWIQQNISTHSDYLCFIENVGVKIGDVIISNV